MVTKVEVLKNLMQCKKLQHQFIYSSLSLLVCIFLANSLFFIFFLCFVSIVFQALQECKALKQEVDGLTEGSHLHILHKVSELNSLPLNKLRQMQMQMRVDLERLDKVRRVLYRSESDPFFVKDTGFSYHGSRLTVKHGDSIWFAVPCRIFISNS